MGEFSTQKQEDFAVDLIDREDALMCLTGEFEDRQYEPSELVSIFSKRIKHLPSTTPQARWIPVSERLPEKSFGCLVTVEEDDIYGEPHRVIYPDFVGYDGETWNNADGWGISFDVIAWMPLPQPYREVENE